MQRFEVFEAVIEACEKAGGTVEYNGRECFVNGIEFTTDSTFNCCFPPHPNFETCAQCKELPHCTQHGAFQRCKIMFDPVAELCAKILTDLRMPADLVYLGSDGVVHVRANGINVGIKRYFGYFCISYTCLLYTSPSPRDS